MELVSVCTWQPSLNSLHKEDKFTILKVSVDWWSNWQQPHFYNGAQLNSAGAPTWRKNQEIHILFIHNNCTYTDTPYSWLKYIPWQTFGSASECWKHTFDWELLKLAKSISKASEIMGHSKPAENPISPQESHYTLGRKETWPKTQAFVFTLPNIIISSHHWKCCG